MKRFVFLMLMISIALTLSFGNAQAGEVTGLKKFVSGTTAVAEEVNDNFTAVATAVKDNDDRIEVNTPKISGNAAAIADNTSDISDNASNISNNAAAIADNASDIQAKGLIAATVFTVSCKGNVSFPSSTYVKVTDIGTFTKSINGSLIEVQFNGTVYAGTMAGTGARFELRVDNQPTTNGWARIALKKGTMGSETTGTMTGIFSNLSAGSHKVSVWVAGANGTGSSAYIDPGCWSSSHVIVKEIN